MRYQKGHLGRTFLLRFEDNDDLLSELEKLVKKERISAATIIFFGALRKGNLVAGPKKVKFPSKPSKVTFKDGWEIVGMGTVFPIVSGSEVHLHAAMGRKTKTLTGCLRKDSKVFLVVEAVVFELKGIRAAREVDPKSGIHLLNLL